MLMIESRQIRNERIRKYLGTKPKGHNIRKRRQACMMWASYVDVTHNVYYEVSRYANWREVARDGGIDFLKNWIKAMNKYILDIEKINDV